MWAPGGLASDGTAIYGTTGNTFGATNYADGESVVRLAPGPVSSGKTDDFFAPTNWKQLDAGDVVIGGSGARLVHVPGATPADLVVALGKDGKAARLDALGDAARRRPVLLMGGAGLVATAADYHRFTQLMLDRPGSPAGELDGTRLLGSRTAAAQPAGPWAIPPKTKVDKVNFVVGSLSAATQLSINAVTAPRKVLFNSISQSDAINDAKDWSLYTFHEALNPHVTSGAVARYAFPKFGKRIVYLTADYAYGQEMARGLSSHTIGPRTPYLIARA